MINRALTREQREYINGLDTWGWRSLGVNPEDRCEVPEVVDFAVSPFLRQMADELCAAHPAAYKALSESLWIVAWERGEVDASRWEWRPGTGSSRWPHMVVLNAIMCVGLTNRQVRMVLHDAMYAASCELTPKDERAERMEQLGLIGATA